MVSHVSGEVIIRIFRQFNLCGSVVDQRCVLVRFSTNKSVEVLKPRVCGPAIVWAGRGDLPWRCLVILTKGCSAETVLSQHFSHRCYRLWPYTVVAGKCSRGFHYRTGIITVMVVTRQQRDSCRRT